MKKLYEKNIITIILIIIIASLIGLNIYKVKQTELKEQEKVHDNYFKEVANKMAKVKSVTIKKRTSGKTTNSMIQINGYDYKIQKIDFTTKFEEISTADNKENLLVSHYVVNDQNTFYMLPVTVKNEEIISEDANYFNDYNLIIKLLQNVTSYKEKDGVYSLNIKHDTLKEYFKTFRAESSFDQMESLWDIKYKDTDILTDVKLNEDGLLSYLKFNLEKLVHDDQTYTLNFSDYDQTKVSIPTELLAKIN